MIVTWRLGVRIGLVLFVSVILQVSFFSFLNVFGTTPDALSVVIICLGLLGGAVLGAVCGFTAGLLLDTLVLQTLGVSSVVLLSVGYLAGRYREGFEISNSLTPPLVAGALTALAAMGYAVVALMLGIDAPVSLIVVRDMLVKGLLGLILAVPIYPLVRRVLRPGLVDYVPVASRSALRRGSARVARQRSRSAGRLRRMRGGLA
jgi:rod shape-determining protein MreD